MMDEIDNFTTMAYESGDSLVITIPANLVKFCGIKKGDWLKIQIKKTQQK